MIRRRRPYFVKTASWQQMGFPFRIGNNYTNTMHRHTLNRQNKLRQSFRHVRCLWNTTYSHSTNLDPRLPGSQIRIFN